MVEKKASIWKDTGTGKSMIDVNKLIDKKEMETNFFCCSLKEN